MEDIGYVSSCALTFGEFPSMYSSHTVSFNEAQIASTFLDKVTVVGVAVGFSTSFALTVERAIMHVSIETWLILISTLLFSKRHLSKCVDNKIIIRSVL